MKEVRFDGPGDRLIVGDIEIVQGQTAELTDETAARLQADRYVQVTVRDSKKAKPVEPPADDPPPTVEQPADETTPDEEEK